MARKGSSAGSRTVHETLQLAAVTMKQQGFTLIEILVAFFLLVLILGGMVGLVQSALLVQRTLLERQAALEEASFAMEYMVRAMRGAQKDLVPDCLTGTRAVSTKPFCSAGGAGVRGCNFEFNNPDNPADPPRVRFIDRENRCREFFASGNRLKEKISPNQFATSFGTPHDLISDDFKVIAFHLIYRGAYQGDGVEDYVQPHINLSLRLNNQQNQRLVNIQSTVMQRILDVQL